MYWLLCCESAGRLRGNPGHTRHSSVLGGRIACLLFMTKKKLVRACWRALRNTPDSNPRIFEQISGSALPANFFCILPAKLSHVSTTHIPNPMRATKLTLLINGRIIDRAKQYSRRHQTSLSKMVSRFLSMLPEDDEKALTPKVRRLSGVLPRRASATEYRAHLRRKYGP